MAKKFRFLPWSFRLNFDKYKLSTKQILTTVFCQLLFLSLSFQYYWVSAVDFHVTASTDVRWGKTEWLQNEKNYMNVSQM